MTFQFILTIRNKFSGLYVGGNNAGKCQIRQQDDR
jgi:hypothetical protein